MFPLRLTRIASLALGMVLLAAPAARAQRQTERLGRGMVAMHSASTQAYVSWRLLATDAADLGFNLYRVSNGGAPVKLNAQPITNTTDFLDTTANFALSNAWYVRPVLGGVEQAPSLAAGLPANSPVRQYLPLPLQPVAGGAYPPYDVKYCWVGDLDGDGEYDYVVDRLSTTGGVNQYLQAYKRDGTLLWQMDMGYNSTNQYNIEPGASAISIGDKDNVTVYDLDGDGLAEVLVRTARGVVLPDATVITGPDDTTQYLSVIKGLTGKELARATLPNPYFADGPLACHFGILYCDGVHPSLVVEGENRHGSGPFQCFSAAWDYRNGQLTQRWFWTPPASGYARGHQIRIADVNRDGIDDLVEIGSVNSGVDGRPLFDTELGHGDRFHTADLDPDRPGLETYAIQQLNPTLLATMLYEAGSGKIIKKWYAPQVVDVGRGDALDMDPRYKGVEVFSTQGGIYDCKGNTIPGAAAPFPTLGIWWDADLRREMFSAADGNGYNPVINKWNYLKNGVDRLYSVYNEGVHTAYGGRPAFFGDILGDWREEFVVVANDYSQLRIYLTSIPARNRLYCLMQNPEYRGQSTCKGYYQASYPDYYLGEDMQPSPLPPVSDAKLVWRGNAGGNWDADSTANWFTNNLWISNNTPVRFSSGDTVLFDLSGSNQAAISLVGTLRPGALTVNSPKHYTFAGPGSLDGAMGLTKAGAGRLTLNNTNLFTGRTLIGEGLFIVNGSLPNSPITVRGGIWLDGRLGGSGVVGGPVFCAPNGGLSPGQGTSSPGILTVAGSLSLSNALSNFDLSDDPAGATKTNDLARVAGNLTLAGTNTFLIRKLSATLPPGIYPLIAYSGALAGGLTNVTVAGLDGMPLALTNPPGQIALVIQSVRAPANLVWAGGLNGNSWDLVTSSNWINGAARDCFVPQDTVRFDNSGAANAMVTLSGALLSGGITVDSSSNYVFNGSGAISGTASLLKTNSGTLTINTDNSYTGRTVIGSGVLAVNDLSVANQPGPLGAAPNTSPTNLVLCNGATWRFPGAQAYTDRGFTLQSGTGAVEVATSGVLINVSGQVVGGGALLKTGPGTLILGASNTYSGGTMIRGGAVQLATEAANTCGLGTGLVTLDGGVLKMLDDSSTYSTASYNLYVPDNSTGELDADSRVDFYGSLTGSGTLNYYVPYVRTTLYGNWSAFTGRLNICPGTGGDSRVTGDGTSGDFRIRNSYGYGNAAIFLSSGINAYHVTSSSAVAIGELSGTNGATLSAAAWTIGAKNTDATFGGNILGNSITKVGTGAWTLTGTNTYSGPTIVSNGTLVVNSSLGTNTVTVYGTLAGKGAVGGPVAVQSGGTLSPGAGLGMLTCSNALTLMPGSTVLMDLSKAPLTNDVVRVAGALTCGGTLVVRNLSTVALAAGDHFQLFAVQAGTSSTSSPIKGAFASNSLPNLNAGLSWNTSRLAVDGTLWVVSTLPPRLGSPVASGTSFTLSAAGGTPGWPCYVLATTNLASPVVEWTRVATNQFDAGGSLNLTLPINSAVPEQFYRVQVP